MLPSIVEIEGHCAILTINNPPANTWTLTSLRQLRDTIEQLNLKPEIRALIITGAGTKFFSAGADLKQFAEGDKALAATVAAAFGAAFETLSQFRGVSIAAINGYAMGGGLEVALACDIRIAEEQAQLALPEASVGLLPCAGGTQNLTALVGEGWAKRMILCGERLTAAKALAIGLIEEVVASGSALQQALKLASLVEHQSPASVTACKRLIQSGRHMPRSQALPLERELFVALFDTEDQQEGVNAFIEKRPAHWHNQ
ncbi:enoyl-CoA hydratase [Shewanella yunxiaonensis]|uniref:Enoyl-CoA hydratase n=1 Tax=Shewanella yunxiaonensis TaxID=2829809 RepID=A0ABX7YQQ9_9GAMM|nr:MULTISPECIES: enoyl-CoA hydratase [Shewanella]MDF0535068.1 enoyl-CoA hydratase [Shewanella sp. A32]QUN04730.1 enoyl-CoA hydratase [Shewanella yunxiaonensis]